MIMATNMGQMPLSPGPMPKMTLNKIMKSKKGSATTKSANRIMVWSVAPPKKPDTLP